MFSIVPFGREENSIFNCFDDFDRCFARRDMMPQFRTDIVDNGDSYLLEAELPGFDKEDIKLDIKDDLLTISAQHKSESEDKDEKKGYLRRERRFGSFSRSFDLSGVDKNAIGAKYDNGILKLMLPKEKSAEPEVRRIEIG
ncbi:MAG: Hsp20/alpha crystallin family protein [Oscillospiraceae bacterium]